MAQKKGKKGKDTSSRRQMKDGAKRVVGAILLFIAAIIFSFSALNKGGVAGGFLKDFFVYLFGIGFYVIPLVCVFLGINKFKEEEKRMALHQSVGGASAIGLAFAIFAVVADKGGVVGHIIAFPFVELFGVTPAIIIMGGLLIIAMIIASDEEPDLSSLFQRLIAFFRSLFGKKKELSVYGEGDETPLEEPAPEVPEEEESEEEVPEEKKVSSGKKKKEEEETVTYKLSPQVSHFVLPPLDLLEGDRGRPNVGDIKANANIIQRTLANFGIIVEMDEVTIGPTVTRYALKPAEGVKLSRIVGLQNELALALAAESIRIEAPIPGKSLVGVEVPNRGKSTVGLASMLSDEKYRTSQKPLTIALGKGLSGKPVFGNLAKMPHALIAGTTGSGKSVTIHSIITSLLYRNPPEDLRFIFVDPKRVELTLYNGIPHLLTPVITDAKKCILALKWAAKEMERRYDILESHSVRDIQSYHEKISSKKKEGEEIERMPYIVVVIDELADIMQAYPRELESAIVRLAQMSRAVGIHLILSTQRPSVNVITGLIKANIPARVALQVSSQIDSRTILDMAGAEKLLGQGDMLFLSNESPQPERLQSAFISEEEVKRVVKYLRDQAKDDLPDEIPLTGTVSTDRNLMFEGVLEGGDDNEDELYEDARRIVIEAQKASTSYLQRKLNVGYARAARLIDMLEEKGVVGPGSGAKPREVYERTLAEEKEEFGNEENV